MEILFAKPSLCLPNLYLHRYELSYRATAPLRLTTNPYELASIFRASLHRVTTLRYCREANPSGRRCDHCNCIYKELFEHRPKANHIHARKFSRAPLPYVFSIVQAQKEYAVGDILRIRVTLFGKANKYIADFLRICQQLSPFFPQKYPYHFELDRVEELSFSAKGEKQNLFQNDLFQDKFLQHRKYLKLKPVSYVSDSMVLNFKQLTCLPQKGKAVLLPSLNFIVQKIWERVCLLNSFYGTQTYPKQMPNWKMLFPQDPEIILESLQTVYWRKQRTRRYNSLLKTKTRETIIGIKGKIRYSGLNMTQYYPLLQLGQYLHLGKFTAFGLGGYEIQLAKNLTKNKNKYDYESGSPLLICE